MPTYEFRCPDGTIIERIYRIAEAPAEIPSPNGDGMAVRIISGGAALLFKGSGFYITDYGKDGKKDQRAAAAGDKGSSGSSDGGGADKGESKTESKSESKTESKTESKSKSESKGDTKSESKGDSKSESKSAESKPAANAPPTPKSD